jgi:hypothetical protein
MDEVADHAEGATQEDLLLKLPLEVRRNLYDLMLTLPCRDHLNLLCLSKQLYGEARESFYRRPLCFESQYDLIDFVAQSSESVLRSISVLHLHLEEIRAEVMQGYLTDILSGNPVHARQHPYLLETKQIKSALSEFPSIKHLALLRPTGIQKSLPSSIVTTQLLNWAAEHLPKLRSLRLDIEQCHIDCLASFTELRSLRLIGFSETSSTRIADVLSRLSSLEELVVTGPPQGLQTLQQHGLQSKIVQSITHQVFERIRPLRRLTLVQATDSNTPTDVFLTLKTIKSLYEIHLESLRAFKISSSSSPSLAFGEYLSAFLLGTPNIEDLSLTWPDMEIAFLDCIPNSVRTLELAVASRDRAQAMLRRLMLMAYRLRRLAHIKFEIINPVYERVGEGKEGEIPPLAFSMPIQHLSG